MHGSFVAALALALPRAGAIRFDDATRAAYSAEASNYRQIPIGVVYPSTLDELATAVAVCRRHGIPVLPRGAGTSMSGQSVNAAVILDTTRYLTAIEEVDPEGMTAIVQPGVICDQLKDRVAPHGLTFGPDPATHSRCSLGGMIGNNACGTRSVSAGKTSDNVEALEVLTYRGDRLWVGDDRFRQQQGTFSSAAHPAIHDRLRSLARRYGDEIRSRFPKIKRRVSGYNLDWLLPENGFHVARSLVGSEGTCVTLLRAKVRLIPRPAHRALLVVGFDDIAAAADVAPWLLELQPLALEGIDEGIVDGLRQRSRNLADVALLPAGNGWLIAEFGGDTKTSAAALARQARVLIATHGKPLDHILLVDERSMAQIWAVRELGASATSLSLDPAQPDPTVGWEDAAVAPVSLGAYLREFRALVHRYGYQTNLYGHFGDGCIHSRITFNLRREEGIRQWRRFLDEASDLVVRFGGSISGEHGDGHARAEFLPKMFGPNLMEAFREFKAIWDPDNMMNPGKIVFPYLAHEHLRLGPDHQWREQPSRFRYPQDQGKLSRAMERCIGAAKCRNLSGGSMCPSFRATGDELLSPRGRARMLFESLRSGGIMQDGTDDALKAALDHCLSCKSCRAECPTQVDIAKYKLEFLAQYYDTNPRSIFDLLMSRIDTLSRWASAIPTVSNWIARNRLVRRLGERAFGISARRRLPEVATSSFRSEFVPRHGDEHIDLLLWTDTYNNHFHPRVLRAAMFVLGSAGYRPGILGKHRCCSRPLLEAGYLDKAKHTLLELIDDLTPYLDRGCLVVFLEPSCHSVFKDELVDLFPDHTGARKLAESSVTLAEAVLRKESLPAVTPSPSVMLHGHCHQHALIGMGAEQKLLKRIGQPWAPAPAGCCGMGGPYGFRKESFDHSIAIANMGFKEACASMEHTFVADGFSCREQAHQVSSLAPMHFAEWLACAINRQWDDAKPAQNALFPVLPPL